MIHMKKVHSRNNVRRWYCEETSGVDKNHNHNKTQLQHQITQLRKSDIRNLNLNKRNRKITKKRRLYSMNLVKEVWRSNNGEFRGTWEAKGAGNGAFMVTVHLQTGNLRVFLQLIYGWKRCLGWVAKGGGDYEYGSTMEEFQFVFCGAVNWN